MAAYITTHRVYVHSKKETYGVHAFLKSTSLCVQFHVVKLKLLCVTDVAVKAHKSGYKKRLSSRDFKQVAKVRCKEILKALKTYLCV